MINTAHFHSDTKLQLEEHDIISDSQDFCRDFDNDSDMRVNHDFEYDSEQVAEEAWVTLIEHTDDPIDLFTLYVLFSHFKPCDVLMRILLLFFHKLCVHVNEHKTTFQRNYSLE